MTPVPPPVHPRPRPRPGRPAQPAGVPNVGVDAGDRPARAGGLAAQWRHPRVTRHGAVGCIAAGIIVFVVASITTPHAGANLAKAPAAPASGRPAAPASVPPYSIDAAAPAVNQIVSAPTHAKNAAPIDHKVIGGLAANGIPRVALNAYRVAAARMGNVEAGCGIDWALLAGIGREESDHGRFGGAVLHPDGVSTPHIVGPALDGVHWDYIPAPANGRALDGDPTYAHALGPMQFIPSTWALYGADADGDGRADVFDIDDAALGAARYLCAAGGDLRSHGGQVRAVLAYNHSDEYLAQVLALSDAYRHGVPITGLPVGITSGSLPKVTDTGYIPPANPGAPTAVDKGRSSSPKTTPKPGSSTSAHRTTSAPAKRSSSASTGRAGAGGGTTTTTTTKGSTGTKSGPGSTTKTAPKPGSSAPSTSPAKCDPVRKLLHLC